MQVKRFQSISKLLSWFFRLTAVIFLIILVFGSLNLYIRQNFTSFSLDRSPAFSIELTNITISDTIHNWASSIIIPIALAFLSYLSFKTSYLFDYLAEKNTPFSYSFSKDIRVIGFLLIFYDLVNPILYSVFINVVLNGGYYIYFGLSSFFFTGLILYLISEILNYGINMQE